MKKSLLLVGLAMGYYGRKKIKNIIPAPDIPKVEKTDVLLYQFSYSPFCIKVDYILSYKKIPFHKVDLIPLIHQRFTKQVSGQSKVPFIVHGSQVVTDSTDIALYLEKEFPEHALFEDGLEDEILLLEDWFDEAMVTVFSKVVYLYGAMNPQSMIDNSELDTGHPMIDRHKDKVIPWMLKRTLKKKGISFQDKDVLDRRLVEVLERVLALTKNEYVLGSKISLADLTLAGHLNVLDKLPHILSDPKYRQIVEWRSHILEQIAGNIE